MRDYYVVLTFTSANCCSYVRAVISVTTSTLKRVFQIYFLISKCSKNHKKNLINIFPQSGDFYSSDRPEEAYPIGNFIRIYIYVQRTE